MGTLPHQQDDQHNVTKFPSPPFRCFRDIRAADPKDLPKDPITRMCLWAYASHASADGSNCYPSVDTIAKETGLARGTVRAHRDALVDEGYLELVEKGRPGRHHPNRYRVILPWKRVNSFDPFPNREKGQTTPRKGSNEPRKGSTALTMTVLPIRRPVAAAGKRAPKARGMPPLLDRNPSSTPICARPPRTTVRCAKGRASSWCRNRTAMANGLRRAIAAGAHLNFPEQTGMSLQGRTRRGRFGVAPSHR